MKVKIFAPSYKRPEKSITQINYPEVKLVVRESEAEEYRKNGNEIIVCPDRDQAGLKLIEQAIDKGWSVSLPDWPAGINDIGDAVNKFGRLYTLYSIANNAESSPLKIRLRAKKWHI